MSDYEPKCDFRKAASVDTSKFDEKAELFTLKSDADELDIDKLKTFPVDLSKRSNDVIKKYMMYLMKSIWWIIH